MALDLTKILDNPEAQPYNSLVNLVDLASTAGEMYLVAPENIRSEVYIFDTRGEEEANLESDITDNWIEDNTTMQDHIGLKPMTITLRGYVGELKNELPKELSFLDVGIPEKLYSLSPFVPKLTTQAQYILNRAEEVYGVYKKANRTISRLEDRLDNVSVPDQVTNQQAIFGKFYDIWKKRSLVTVYTPFGVFNNMAILSLNGRQDESSAFISEFSVTFKQIRIANKILTYEDTKKQKDTRAAMTLAQQLDKGIKKPKSVSGIKQIVSYFKESRG